MKKERVNNLCRSAKRFGRDDTGSMSIFGIFIFVCAGILGAFALDVTNLFAHRTHLQTAADQAAHAALYNRVVSAPDAAGRDAAVEAALGVIEATLPESVFGTAAADTDIEFGIWDAATRTFTPDPNAGTAARVRTGFLESRDNAAQGFLFRLIGFDQFDVRAESIYTTYFPACLREGFVADGIVDIQSNNVFSKGFCLHSNTHVSLNSNNIFEPGTIVSMPDLADLDLPKSGFETNEGLQAALRQGSMDIRVLDRIENMIYFYRTGDTHYPNYPSPHIAADTMPVPDYITDLVRVEMRETSVDAADLEEGHIYLIDCKGSSGLTIDASDAPLREVVIVTPCKISFAGGSVIEDSRIISSSTDDRSVTAPSGLQVGRQDNCLPGGGAQLITRGGMSFASGLEVYGSQLMAQKDITFSAQADGVLGASFIAGGKIDSTSLLEMGLCEDGMDDAIQIRYFRMAG